MLCIGDQNNDEINLENPDIAKYKTGFEKVQCKLIDYIDPFNKLPFCCVENEIMTFEEADAIERFKPQTTQEIVSKMNAFLKKRF